MAFTFSTATVAVGTQGYLTDDPVTGLLAISASTNTSSAAGTFYCGFKPRRIDIFDETNANQYTWCDGMAAASMFKHAAAGTFTIATSNGITVADTTSATVGNGPYAVTLGTGIHTNSSIYRIVAHK